jgi:hypothetical protein
MAGIHIRAAPDIVKMKYPEQVETSKRYSEQI